jgi:hypothetical protein
MNRQNTIAATNADRFLVGFLSEDIKKFHQNQQSAFEKNVYSPGNCDCTMLNGKKEYEDDPYANYYRQHVEG